MTHAPEPPELHRLSGAERAATLMLALGREHGAPLWPLLAEAEVIELSAAMARLGKVPPAAVEALVERFALEVGGAAGLAGSLDSTERLLGQLLPPERTAAVMAEVRGPAGRATWEQLGKVDEALLAAFLAAEGSGTVAVVLGQLKPDRSARVLALLPPELAGEVLAGMLAPAPVSDEVLGALEAALRAEFIDKARGARRDPHAGMAELFNALDRASEERLMGELERRDAAAAGRVRALMFTFADLGTLPPRAVQQLLARCDKALLPRALKGAPPQIEALFFANMSERSAKLLREDMETAGPVKLRDVEAARQSLVRLAKRLADEGEIELATIEDDEEMVA